MSSGSGSEISSSSQESATGAAFLDLDLDLGGLRERSDIALVAMLIFWYDVVFLEEIRDM